MQIIVENDLRMLVPTDKTKYLVKKEELILPEEDRYYFQVAYIPPSLTLEECEEIYVEVEKEIERGE